jgi:hypothetical protein
VATRPRVSIQIPASLHSQLRIEAERRGLSVARLAEFLIERGLPKLPPLPDADD